MRRAIGWGCTEAEKGNRRTDVRRFFVAKNAPRSIEQIAVDKYPYRYLFPPIRYANLRRFR
jgi:hypothetical protein